MYNAKSDLFLHNARFLDLLNHEIELLIINKYSKFEFLEFLKYKPYDLKYKRTELNDNL